MTLAEILEIQKNESKYEDENSFMFFDEYKGMVKININNIKKWHCSPGCVYIDMKDGNSYMSTSDKYKQKAIKYLS